MIQIKMRISISCDFTLCEESRHKEIEASDADNADKDFPRLCLEFSVELARQGWSISSPDGNERAYCPSHAHVLRR